MESVPGLKGYLSRSRSGEQFPDPFCDIASLVMPQSMPEALSWTEHIILSNGPYREALRRVIAYFITDIEIRGVGEKPLGRETRRKYEDFLNDTLGIREVLADVCLDFLTYGNSFTSVMMPFRRYLSCKECGLERPFKRIANEKEYKFSWNGFKFTATCPSCGYAGEWNHADRRSGESGKIRVKRWDPHTIQIKHDQLSGDREYYWRIPDNYRSLIRQGDKFRLERANMEVLDAVKNNHDMLLDPDIVHHMHESTLAGVYAGWGISKVLTNFRQAWYVQVLMRYNEAIALDYVIPFRVLTPLPRPGAAGDTGDPVMMINQGDFVSRIMRMLKERRRDPARWNVLPFPLDYKALGGDANQLCPKDLIEMGMDALLNSIGVPVELYRGSLTAQSAPGALRLFEANWAHLVHKMNAFLAEVVKKVSQLMSWEPVTARMIRVKHADDLNRQMALLQLMMGGQISRTTGLANLNLDFEDEEERKLDEEKITAEKTQDAQEDMQNAAAGDQVMQGQQGQGGSPSSGGQPDPSQGGQPQQGAAPAGGGMPPPAGPMGQPQGPGGAAQTFAANMPMVPNQPTTPEELESMAQTIVQKILPMPDSQRRTTLLQLKKEDQTGALHAMVLAQLEDADRQAASQGKQQVMQQQYGKTAAALPKRCGIRGLWANISA